MKSQEFKPTRTLAITNGLSMRIQVKSVEGEDLVFSAYYDVAGKRCSHISKSFLRADRHGAYFFKGRVKQYITEFIPLDSVRAFSL